MNDTIIIIIIILFVVLTIKIICLENIVYKNTEHLTISSNESVQNIASMYNSGKLTVSDLVVNGTATINNASFNTVDVSGGTTLKSTKLDGDLSVTGAGTFNAGTFNSVNCNGKLTVSGGSSFEGGRHYFQDQDKAGILRVGGVNGYPGIYAENGKSLQVQDFNFGTTFVKNNNTNGMINKSYNYIKSNLPSAALVNNSQSGYFLMPWNNGDLYWTYLSNNTRYNSDHGHISMKWGA